MNMVDIIQKKKEGRALSDDEIRWFVDGYVSESIPDYQISALLMAIYFKGLSKEETFCLTDAMRYSGDTVDLSPVSGIKVDKHSSHGMGASGSCELPCGGRDQTWILWKSSKCS